MSLRKKVLFPLPASDFDPTETGVSWEYLQEHDITFATPKGDIPSCDPIMLHGKGLGVLAPLLVADKNGKLSYDKMIKSDEFKNPIAYDQIIPDEYDVLILAGGHAKGMRPYLESEILQRVVGHFFDEHKVVGAICHGLVLVARSNSLKTGEAVLKGRKTTSLLKSSEMLAYHLTKRSMGEYYLTYPGLTVEDEVKASLEKESDFLKGPPVLIRDTPNFLLPGYIVEDGNFISARWPGDAHKFALALKKKLS
tara:strand:- start:258568 stop:259323 length:756 start_codon:yes stop_codon:yes gene_type:complete